MRRRSLSAPVAVCLTITSALLLRAAFPAHNFWWLAPLAVSGMLVSVRGQGTGRAAWLGGLGGLVFYLAHVQWTSEFLGPVPWVALASIMGAWWAAGHALIAVAYRRWRGHPAATAIAVTGIWVAREGLSSTVPYGGFAWGRLAQSQAGAPLAAVVSWGGFALLSAVIVLLAALALEALLHPRSNQPQASRWAGVDTPFTRALGIATLVATALVVPAWQLPQTGSVRILAVQGDTPGASYFIPSERGEILLAHAEATRRISPDTKPDIVLWPEGSVDVNPLDSPAAAHILDEIVAEYDAPLLANTVTRTGDWDDPATEYFNTQFVWDRSGFGTQYDKAHPIPFGEYVPDREFYAFFAPELIGMIQREYTPGVRSNVLDSRGVGFGVFICYDVVDDELAREAIVAGADVLLAPTNNADFARTDESAQQLATARLRAIESGRSLVQASTVGWSAAYAPDGTELAALDWYEPGAFIVDAPVTTGTTPGILLGRAVELTLGGAGLVLTLARRRARSAR